MPIFRESDMRDVNSSDCNGFDSDEWMASDGEPVQLETSSDDVLEGRCGVEKNDASHSGELQQHSSVTDSHKSVQNPAGSSVCVLLYVLLIAIDCFSLHTS